MNNKEKLELYRNNRIGLCKKNYQGYLMTITEYENANNVKIEFEEINKVKYRTIKNWDSFNKGCIKNPYVSEIYNVGYVGEYGIIDKLCYRIWFDMLKRCYNEKYLTKEPSYKDCVVCEEWLNYYNFYKWWDKNYYEIPNERMELDKDILVKGNKIYSPHTCCFVPQKINGLFIKCKNRRGKYLIGVSLNTNKRLFGKEYPYLVRCSVNNKTISKYFKTQEEGFMFYKEQKENEIKRIANLYKYYIPNKLYNAMINYKIERND